MVARRHPFRLSVVDVGDSLADRVADDLLFRSALARLPARQREAVVLRYYADLSESDMAETMGVSVGSVKTHLHRAMKALASSLGESA